MLTGDSGPMHAAAAPGAPVLALFGPTLPERTGPWGADHAVIQEARPPHPNTYRHDPEGKHIRSIAVGTVRDALDALLEKHRPPACGERERADA